ncbi:MAG: helix-turn-helix transcriptional regulator [Clostridia bacterium]|nr:helix-turn-helix transcriptional regulator [Clostridia bacterium]
MNTIGKRILYLRELYEIKQKDLAAKIGVTNATMCKYENDTNIPNADILSKIAEALNTSTDYLVGRTSSISKNRDTKFDTFSTENLFDMILKLNTENRLLVYERVFTLWEQQQKSECK